MILRQISKRNASIGLAWMMCINNSRNEVEKKDKLQKIMKETNMVFRNSVLIQMKNKQQQSSTVRILDSKEKQLLRMLTNKRPLSRMTLSNQGEYCENITTKLYATLASRESPLTFRIMQNTVQTAHFTIELFINTIYKDIFARYLAIKGANVEWDGFFSDYGALNAGDISKPQINLIKKQEIVDVLRLINECSKDIQETNAICMYSYAQSKEIPMAHVEIEKVKKIGSYIKAQVTGFGQFNASFTVLTRKKQKFFILIFVSDLLKLVKPDAIVIPKQSLMIILSNALEYLVVDKETYQKHKTYFQKERYFMHGKTTSNSFIRMKAADLQIIAEAEGIEGKKGFQLISGAINIVDYERLLPHNVKLTNFITKDGLLPNGMNIFSPQLQYDLHIKYNNFLCRMKQKINFASIHDVYEDHIYSHKQTKEILRFRLLSKIVLKVDPNAAQNIWALLQERKTQISESKVQIDRPQMIGKQPKEKRRIRKHLKELKKQVTEYLSLEEALHQCEGIAIQDTSKSDLQLPIIKKKNIFQNYACLEENEQIQLVETGQINSKTIKRLSLQGYSVENIFINQRLLKNLKFLALNKKKTNVRQVIIQSQSETQTCIAEALHIDWILNGANYLKKKKLQPFFRILFHPTICQSQQNFPVEELILGTEKSNGQRMYGFGLEGIRLWVASKDNLKGNREISQNDFHSNLKISSFVRNTFNKIMQSTPVNSPSLLQDGSAVNNYLDRFMLDQIQYFIQNMDAFYANMQLHQAFNYLHQFFERIVQQIYLKVVLQNIRAYPNAEINRSHFFVLNRLLSLVAVIAPLIPFSAYHVTKTALLKWPQVLDSSHVDRINLNNDMIKIHVLLHAKMEINHFNKVQLQMPKHHTLTDEDLRLFFGATSMTPPIQNQNSFRFSLAGYMDYKQQDYMIVTRSKEHCTRCFTKSNFTSLLCNKCSQYLLENAQRGYIYFT